jgi:hypothetical protein
MKRWINMARKYKLNVWFRGNAAGWEGWFGYPWLTREDHTKEIEKFILSNGDLFEDGDIFSSCPECENGGDGDPRLNGDVVGHREFLIKEYGVVREAFQRIDKDVAANFNPMNGDVAQLIMDRETTKALGGIVVVDHYVGTPEQLAEDAKSYANSSGGKVVIGEFGVPIPDIHGNMTEAEQAAWLSEALKLLSEVPEVIGVNYWTSHGGSTRLWDDDGGERQAVSTLKKYFVPYVFTGVVKDETGKPITDARIQIENQVVLSNKQGEFTVKHLNKAAVAISAYGYETVPVTVNMDEIILKRTNPNIIYRVKKFLRSISISTLTGK